MDSARRWFEMKRRWVTLFPLVLSFTVLAGLYYFPLIQILALAGRFSWSVIFQDPFLKHVLFFTYQQAFFSACLSACIGLPGAFLLARSQGKLSRFWGALVLVPFSLPPILVVLGVAGAWGRQGLLSQFLQVLGFAPLEGVYGWLGILVAHSIFNFPLFLKIVGQSLKDVELSEEKAALSLGASRLRVFVSLTWPKTRADFFTAFLLSFVFCASSFLIVLTLGGSPRFTTIEVAIYQALKMEFDLGLAVQLALIQLGVVGLLTLGFLRTDPPRENRQEVDWIYDFRSRAVKRVFTLLYALFLGLLVGLPLLSIFIQGAPALRTFSLWSWAPTFFHSVKLASLAASLSVILALGIQHSVRHQKTKVVWWGAALLCALPLGISSLLIVLGWRVTYPSWLGSGSWAVVFVQAVVALPIVYRPLQEAFFRISDSTYQSAVSLGASAWQVWWRIEFPLLRSSLVLGFLLGFAIALGEAGAVLLFLNEATENLTYRIYYSMVRYRFAEAHLGGLLLLFLSSVTVLGVSTLEFRKWKA